MVDVYYCCLSSDETFKPVRNGRPWRTLQIVTAVVVRDFMYNDVHKQLPFMHGGRSAYRGSDGVVCLNNKQSGCEGVCLFHDTADLPLPRNLQPGAY